MNYTQEQLEAAKAVKTPEELIALAKENGAEITREQAERFLNPSFGKLSDEELDNVAGGHGGLCHDKRGREVVTLLTVCVHVNNKEQYTYNCSNKCQYLSYESGIWYCNFPPELKT